MSSLHRLRGLLSSPRMPWLAAALALLLALPSLLLGLETDDHVQLERLDQGGTAWSLFATLEDWGRGPRARGQAAWWSGDMTVRFVRPIAAATHVLDHALFRDLPWVMHLHNALLYAALALLAALGYRQVLGAGSGGASATAGVAALLY